MAFLEFNTNISGFRPSAGTYVNGVFIPGSLSPVSIQSSIQPSTDKEIKLLPEGRRIDSAWTLRSEEPILVGDIYSIYGEDHEVLKIQIWQNGIIPHYMGIATKVQS